NTPLAWTRSYRSGSGKIMSKVMQSGPAFLLRMVEASRANGIVLIAVFPPQAKAMARASFFRNGSGSALNAAPGPVPGSTHLLKLESEQFQRVLHGDDVVEGPLVRGPRRQHFIAHEGRGPRCPFKAGNPGVHEVAPGQVGHLHGLGAAGCYSFHDHTHLMGADLLYWLQLPHDPVAPVDMVVDL